MKILIATDGSDYSRAAVAACCRMVVHPENAEIVVVSAYENAYPIAAEPFALSAEYYKAIDEAAHGQAEAFVADAAWQIEKYFGGKALNLTTKILQGSPVQQIVETAREANVDLIVVGSHGRGFWGRLLGSVSDGVVHHAPCSVLVVRDPES